MSDAAPARAAPVVVSDFVATTDTAAPALPAAVAAALGVWACGLRTMIGLFSWPRPICAMSDHQFAARCTADVDTNTAGRT